MKTCAVIAVVLLAAAAPGARAQTGAGTVSLSDYRALVARSRRAAENGLSAAEVSALRQRLSTVRQVAEPDGRRTAVDNRALLADLQAFATASGPADRRTALNEAQKRLRALDAALAPPPRAGEQETTAGDPRDQVKRILATDEFRRAAEGENAPKSWLEKQWDALGKWFERQMAAFGRWLRRLFGGVRGPNLPSGTPNWLLSLAGFLYATRWLWLIAAVLVALYFVLRGRALPKLAGRRRGRPGGGTGLDLDENEFPDPLAAAKQRAAAGDYRTALRLAYIASLRRLAGAGLLVLEPNKTNWEYQRALRGGPSRLAYDALLPATRLFDRVWYGRQNASLAEFERVVAAHDALPATAEEAKTSSTQFASAAESGAPS